MNRKLRILISEDEEDIVAYYQALLPRLGHEIVGVARTGQELIDLGQELKPDVVVADVKLPDTDGIEAARILAMHRPVPVVLVSGYIDEDLLLRALDDHVMAYLHKPISEAALEAAIAVAVARYQEFLGLKMESEHLKQTLADRKLLDRAKGILMNRSGITDEEAMHRIHKLALEKKQRVTQIAQMLVDADLVMHPLHDSDGQTPQHTGGKSARRSSGNRPARNQRSEER